MSQIRVTLLVIAVAGALVAPVAAQDDTVPWLPLPEGEVSRIAWGSCSNQYLAQPIWKALATAAPDLFLYQGDIIYGDAAPPGTRILDPSIDQLAKMKMDYQFLSTHPDFIAVKNKIPVMATWDDHDYGKNDGGADFELKEQSRELLFDFLDIPADSERRLRPGVYDARIFGPPGRRVQVIMLDTRYFRSPLVRGTLTKEEAAAQNIVGRYVPNTDPNATMLGEAQWRWLEDQVQKPAEVRLLNSSIQVVAGEKGAESWGNLPHERQRLYDLIRSTKANGLIILSGDVHYAEFSKSDKGPYPLYEFTSSPLAQYPTGSAGWETCVNSFRISETFVQDNFGLVKIDWQTKPSPTIAVMVIGIDGSSHMHFEISLDHLQGK